MDPSLIGHIIRCPKVKVVWNAASITYFDKADKLQLYDLQMKVTSIRQVRGSIENYYNDLQSLWREIDFRRPNPMECATNIGKYNSLIQEERVYIFLDVLDKWLDKIHSDLLWMKQFLTVEEV